MSIFRKPLSSEPVVFVFFLTLSFIALAGCSAEETFGTVGTSNLESGGVSAHEGSGGGNSDADEDNDEDGEDGEEDDRDEDERDDDDKCDDRDQRSDGKKKKKPEPAVERPSHDEMSRCSRALGVPVQRFIVAGRSGTVNVSVEQTLIVKIVGSQNQVNVTVPEGIDIAGVCLVSAGNQGRAALKVNGALGKLAYLGLGNRNQSDVIVKGPSAKIASISAAMFGRENSLTISGDGQYNCPSRSSSVGSGNQVVCGQ